MAIDTTLPGEWTTETIILVFVLFVSALVLGATLGIGFEKIQRYNLKTASGASFNDSNLTAEKTVASTDSETEEKFKIPRHIAVIMDGNRRFGMQKHADPLQGHWAGGQTLVDFVQWSMARGVEIVTVYAFSTENWSRDPLEVTTLMTIFAKYAETFRVEALSRNVRVNILSTDREKLPPKVQKSILELENSTAHCDGFIVNICLSYGGRGDIVQACQRLATEVQDGKRKVEEIDEQSISAVLTTSSYPDPDILIRTSGEHRISNFLLWQLAYTECFFVDEFWPQFTQAKFTHILREYTLRSRRFGV